jgi:hypothetical protein
VEDDHLDMSPGIDLGSSSFFDDIDPSALDVGAQQAVVPPAAALSAVMIDGGDTDIPDERLPLALRLQRQLAREAASAARPGRADSHSPAFRYALLKKVFFLRFGGSMPVILFIFHIL